MDVRYELSLVVTKKEFDKEKYETMSRFLPGTSTAKIYNKLLDEIYKYFGETGVYLLSLTKPAFELIEKREYEKVLNKISTQ